MIDVRAGALPAMASSSPSTAETLLSRFPHYQDSTPLEEISADISPEAFYREFVLRHRPCVIRGAVHHWPAVHEWSTTVLRSKVGSTVVGTSNAGVVYEPIVEYGLSRLFAPSNQMTVAQFLDEVAAERVPRVQVYAEHLATLRPLEADLGGFDFLDAGMHPARTYSDRFFFSRRGYTDWHVHYGDESLTAQLLGSKELLLLPPDRRTFAAMMPMAKRGVWKTPAVCWPDDFSQLVPLRATLLPGDAIYIPMHWWHAVEAVGDDFNATFAHVFGTPQRWLSDVRLVNVRYSLKMVLALSALMSLRSRRPRYVRQVGRMAGAIVAGLPAALFFNRRPLRHR